MPIYQFSDIATDVTGTAQVSSMISYFRQPVVMVFGVIMVISGIYLIIRIVFWAGAKLPEVVS